MGVNQASEVARVSADEVGSFDAFVAAEYAGLRRYAYVLTANREDADDLVQAALVKTALHWSRIKHPEAATAYVRKTMLRQQLNRWRRFRLERNHAAAAQPKPPTGDHAEDVVDRDAVWLALSKLAPRQRAVLVLRFYDDLSEQATAEALGCAVGTVKSLTSRALERLRESPSILLMEDS